MKKPSYEVTVKDKSYSLKLTTTAVMGIEAKINGSFATAAVQTPSVTLIAITIEGALKESEPKSTLKDAVDFIDAYLDDHSETELLELYNNVLETSGFFSRRTSTEI